MSPDEIIFSLIFAAGFIVLFAVGELLYHVLKLPVEITRKFVHMCTGLICLLLPVYFTTHWSILLLNISFIAILGISMKLNLLKSINAVKRKSSGSLLFPIVMYLSWCVFLYTDDVLYFYLPVLILAISDPIAALVGKSWPKGPYTFRNETKTMSGSISFFTSALAICLLLGFYYKEDIQVIVVMSLVISLLTTVSEALSQKGFDNLFIPLSAIAGLFGIDYIFVS